MPLNQIPQWTEFLSCPVCYHEFNENVRRPISLGCGHTVCRTCLSQLQRKQCPFDNAPITQDIEDLPANYALLQLVGAEVTVEEQKIPANVVSKYMKHYAEAKACIEELALYLKPLGIGGAGSNNCILSRPMQRKLVTLVNCQLVEEEGRSRAMRGARSLGERTVTELMLQHQNTQQLSANLWAAVRARGCQFLGPAMQEETLKLVLLALEDGAALSRKVLVMFVVQKLEQQFPQASKTSVGHVVQLLYRASCFKVTKRNEESSLMQLKEEFRNYEALRREHDGQIVQIAMEGGLRISPEQWSSLLYGDLNHKSHMQSIIDKQLQTPASFTSSIQELTIALQRSGDPANLGKLREHLKLLADINPNNESEPPAWEDVELAMISTKIVVHGLVEFIAHHSHSKKILEQQQTQNIKYKTSMCRDITQKGGCPRGTNCTFAHSEDELDKYRAKSRRMLSTINRQNSNQSTHSITSQPPSNLVSRGLSNAPALERNLSQIAVDVEADDDGLMEKKMNREPPASTQSPRRIIHPPADSMIDQEEDKLRYPPHADVKIPYRPPVGHYDHHYAREYHHGNGYPPGPPPPGSYPMPPPPYQYGHPPYGHPKDPVYGHPKDPAYGHPKDPAYGHPKDPAYGHPKDPAYGHPKDPAYGHPKDPAYGHPKDPAYRHPKDPQDLQYDSPRDMPPPPSPIYRHPHGHPHGDGYGMHPYYADKEPRPPPREPFPYENGVRRDAQPDPARYYPSIHHRYPAPLRHEYDRQFEAEASRAGHYRDDFHHVRDDLQAPNPPPRSQGPDPSPYPPRYYLDPREGSPNVDKSDGLKDDGYGNRISSGHSNQTLESEDVDREKEQAALIEIVEKQERERAEKEKDKKRVDKYLQNIETPPNIPTNLIELQQREKVLVGLLKDHRTRSPWDQPAVTKLVSSNQGRPKSSSMISSVENYTEGQSPYYDPWTSTASLFDFHSFMKPGKEGTKYTMTVSKSQIKHVSAKETEQMVLEKPYQGKEHPEFTRMNLDELKKTLEEVKQQDHKTGCTHFERSHELNQELIKRENRRGAPPPSEEDSHHVITSFFQDDHYLPLWGSPVSRASRTSFNITPPVKVNAGPTGPGGGAPCTPVSINLSNQMVPIAGQSPVADRNVDLFHRGILDVGVLDESHNEDVPSSRNQHNKEELEEMLAQVSTQIAKEKAVKTANDAFLIQRESRAIQHQAPDTNLPHSSNVQQLENDMEFAKRLQRREFQGHSSDRSAGDLRSSSPYHQPAFHLDNDFPPLSREILDQQARDKRMVEEVRNKRIAEEAQDKSMMQASRHNEAPPRYSEVPVRYSDAPIRYSDAPYPPRPHYDPEMHQRQQRQQQEMDDSHFARQLARDEARKAGVRLPSESKGYGDSRSYWPGSQ